MSIDREIALGHWYIFSALYSEISNRRPSFHSQEQRAGQRAATKRLMILCQTIALRTSCITTTLQLHYKLNGIHGTNKAETRVIKDELM